jgi:hypothetical protein
MRAKTPMTDSERTLAQLDALREVAAREAAILDRIEELVAALAEEVTALDHCPAC